MGTNADTYVLIGCDVGPDWGKLPTDGQGEQDAYDDWHDRHGHLEIYRPKPGDLVSFTDMDSNRYRYIGRVLGAHFSKWDIPEFDITLDERSLSDHIGEVTMILYDTYGIVIPVKLHIITIAS
jgi:hypothetical protein